MRIGLLQNRLLYNTEIIFITGLLGWNICGNLRACWIEYKMEIDQTWWFSVSKPKIMSDVCPIFAAYRVEFKTENDQTGLFSLCKPKNVRKSHFCCVPNSVRVKEWSKLTIFTLKTWNWIYDDVCRIESEVE